VKQRFNFRAIRNAALLLPQASESLRNTFLDILGKEIVKAEKKILSANTRDVRDAKKKGLPAAFVERLVLDKKGVKLLTLKLKDIKKLKSGLGEVIEQRKEKAGFTLRKVRVPLGVLLVIYEARPEVTIDVAALCVKSGNAAILKGGSEALRTNAVLYDCITSALKKSKLSTDSVTLVQSKNRSVTNQLLLERENIDLVIARGSYGMVKAVLAQSSIPVLAHAAGGARIYVDKTADLKMAEKILINAKVTKPSACNTLDTVLIHKGIAKRFVPQMVKAFVSEGVVVKGDAESVRLAPIVRATAKDWDTEFLGLTVALKVVSGVEDAVRFTNTHSKRHTEGIVAKNEKTIRTFTQGVDAAALFVNASTRLHDGYVFGLGSEMGISTEKLHARGPVGLKELTTYRWEVYGKGTIRK
jgi:glutamate-5-semialdehyde dehydrogenase